MTIKNIFQIIFCLILFSCTSKLSEDLGEVIIYDSDNVHFFSKIVDSVDFIPLKINNLSLDDFSEVYKTKESIFVVDKTLKKSVYYFDAKGQFMNLIGSSGRAYNEYLELSDFMLSGDSLLIFDSKNRKVFFYGMDGRLLRKDTLINNFQKARRIKNDYILYLGDCNADSKYKLFMEKSDDKFLKSNSNVMHFTELFPVFCSHGDSVYVRETLSNKIRLLYDNKISTLYTFDFGNYSIPDEFYTQSSAHESMEILLNQDYTYQKQFCIASRFALIENIMNRQDGVRAVYAILNRFNDKWLWVNQVLEQENDPFSGTFKFIDEEGYFYFLLDKVKQNALAEYGINIDGYEYGLLKCKLKID